MQIADITDCKFHALPIVIATTERKWLVSIPISMGEEWTEYSLPPLHISFPHLSSIRASSKAEEGEIEVCGFS